MSPTSEPADCAALTDLVRRFALQEIAPHVAQWDEAGEFPRSLYGRAAELGLLGLGYPEELGGTPATQRLRNALCLPLARYGASGGVFASLFSHNIGLPPVLHHASAELQAEVIPPVLLGEKIAALAITEPGGGSDVAALRCSARRDAGDYVLNGEKVYITSGMRADYITTAVRTGEPGSRGASGISMIVVPTDAVGLARTRLQKMGWWCSDTAHLRFDNMRVPARFLVGLEGAGFRMIMRNFNGERLAMSVGALGFAQACFDEALDWARQRRTFGAALVEHQVIRHKLVDMQMRIASTQAWIEALTTHCDQDLARLPGAGLAQSARDGPQSDADFVAQVCMLKNHATQSMQFCADQAVQIMGAMGFMRGTRSERIYREVKVMMVGGGAEEIMKELAARQLGL